VLSAPLVTPNSDSVDGVVCGARCVPPTVTRPIAAHPIAPKKLGASLKHQQSKLKCNSQTIDNSQLVKIGFYNPRFLSGIFLLVILKLILQIPHV